MSCTEKNTYKIDTSELKIYKLGESFEEALPKALAGIQKSLESMSKNINRQTAFLDKKSKAEETHWNEYELKQKLNYMSYVKRRNKELDIDQDAYLFKKMVVFKNLCHFNKLNQTGNDTSWQTTLISKQL